MCRARPTPSGGTAYVALAAAMPLFNRTYIVYDRKDRPALPMPNVIETVRRAPSNVLLRGVNGLAAR